FENYLITQAIPATIPLDEFLEQQLPLWPEPRQSRFRRKVTRALAVLSARLHSAGIVHVDFHPGNILVGIGPDDEPRLAMIDLDGLRVARPVWQFWEDFGRLVGINLDARRWSPSLSWTDAKQNLALLNHYFWLRC